jgi:type I restriction enzyme S subunit
MSTKAKPTAKKEEAKSTLVPRLRFPVFENSNDWQMKLLGSLCKIRTGKKDANEGASDGQYPFFTCAENHIFSHSYSFDAEAILIAGNANVGQTKYYCGKFEAYQRTYVLTDFSEVSVPYLYAVLSAKLRESLLKQVQASAMSYIKLPMLQEYALAVPPSPAEQQTIAQCLSSVDELMAAQARKLDALKTHKKGLMQRLFPREGETQPRLRFPEFQKVGEWQPTSLGNVARLRNGYAFKSAEYVADGPYQIITIANVQQGNLTLESTKRMAALPPDIQKHQVLTLGDILISMTGNVGRVCLVTDENLLLNQRVGKLVPEKIEAVFFYHLLQRDEFRSNMQLKAAGGAQGNLSAGDITEYAFSSPTNPDEQQRIAECLSSLDALITAEIQKLEALKIHKKGLMQQLFPSPEEN